MMRYSEKLKVFTAAHPCSDMTVDGARYRYILDGKDSGRTLVFLNGGMNTLEMWMADMIEDETLGVNESLGITNGVLGVGTMQRADPMRQNV